MPQIKPLTSKEEMLYYQVGREYAKALNLCITPKEYKDQKQLIEIAYRRKYNNDQIYWIEKGLREGYKH